jgi:hypothetical protein
MSALGQKQTFRNVRPMSAIHPKGDIAERKRHVCFVPKADIRHAYLTRSPRRRGQAARAAPLFQMPLQFEC